jgi:hypothetical protein
MDIHDVDWTHFDLMLGFKASPETYIAFEIVKTASLITAILKEKTAVGGRTTAEETIHRAFEMARAFIHEAKKSAGPLVPTPLEISRMKGRFAREMEDAKFPKLAAMRDEQ